MLPSMTAALVFLAAIGAILSYRVLEEWTPRNWLPAACRAVGWGSIALLLTNAGCPVVPEFSRPIVLLDASLSMQAAGGRWTEALALARSSGEVRFVGVPAGDTTPTGGRSLLAAAIIGALGSSRPIVVITDGEIDDADALPVDRLGNISVKVLERAAVPDVALTRVEGTTRLTVSDSLRFDIEALTRGGAAGNPLRIEVREGDRVWLRGVLPMDSGGRGRVVLKGVLPSVSPGVHVLSVAIIGARDAEPRTDARLQVVTVVPTPGIVLLASPPTWESRFLLQALNEVAALPVRGYLELERGRWRRAGSLIPVSAVELGDAARRADLLITLGAPGELARRPRARAVWSWPALPPQPGAGADWYLSVPSPTPLSAAFAGLAVDSFPPGTSISELIPGPQDWIGLTAQAGRRGAVRPVLIGRDSAGVRRVTMGVEGLWRWTFRGGSSEQGYRGLVSATLSWLLGGADSVAGKARLLRPVVQQGRPAVFEWSGGGAPSPVAIELSGTAGTRQDTLIFDGAGRSQLAVPPGSWRYRLSGGGQGTIAVEEYSDELLPTRRSLESRQGTTTAELAQVPVRGWLWLFGIAVVAFAGEWLARRRRGLR